MHGDESIQLKCDLHHQVVREVAVLDNINPGGMYASRVKMLGRYKSFPDPSFSDILSEQTFGLELLFAEDSHSNR